MQIASRKKQFIWAQTHRIVLFCKKENRYILCQMCKDGILQPDGVGRGTKYKSVK